MTKPPQRLEPSDSSPRWSLVLAGVGLALLLIPAGLAVAGSGTEREQSSTPASSPKTTTTEPRREETTTTRGTAAVLASRVRRGLTIQLVPAVRDFRIRVGSRTLISDAEGTIVDSDASGSVSVALIGYTADPSLKQVTFVGWSDGSSAALRSIDVNQTNSVELGLQISYRVTAAIAGDRGPSPTEKPITFRSSLGQATLVPGQPAWVPAIRAERDGDRYVEKPLEYHVGSDPSRRFTPSPEALWSVRP